MIAPQASVIVRAKNKQREIGRALSALRSQTVPIEVIVVDSGSTDGTVDIARRYCDHLIEIPPEEFTYGYALNLGAAAARAPIHFALSAHCAPEQPDWVERSLSHYERSDVAGTGSYGSRASGGEPPAVVYQDLELLQANPYWGLSSHAGSWRGSLWQRFPFNEAMESAEDREWSWRVLREGWVIAMDPKLGVGTPHRTSYGPGHWYRICRRDVRALSTFMPIPSYRRRDVVKEWWNVDSFGIRARVSPWRMLALVAKYHGIRDGARVRRGERPPWTPGSRRGAPS